MAPKQLTAFALVCLLLAAFWLAAGCADLDIDGKTFACNPANGDADCAGGKICEPSYRVCVLPSQIVPDTHQGDSAGEGGDTDGEGGEADAPDSSVDGDAADGEELGDDTAESDISFPGDTSDSDIAPTDGDGGESDGALTDTEIEDATGDGSVADAGDTGPDTVQPGGPCPPDMVLVEPQSARGANAACVDRYEASRQDATATSVGSDNQGAPRSAKGVLPWTNITRPAALSACAKAGKRLCTMPELAVACGGGPPPTKYPYGTNYQPGGCNGHASGFNKALPTGSISTCQSVAGVFDVSGNVQEWTTSSPPSEEGVCAFGGDYSVGGVSGAKNQAQEACDPTLVDPEMPCWPVSGPTISSETLGFRCCKDPFED